MASNNEQKINIATYFIMSSPTAQVREVVTDVRKLVNDANVLSDAALTKIMREYNSETMFVASTNDNNNTVLISNSGEIAAGKYLETASGTVYEFDHLKQKITGKSESKSDLDEGVEKHRAAIEKQLSSYIDSSYKQGKCKLAVFGKSDGTITVCVSASNVNLNNYWAGSWRGKYTLNVSKQGDCDVVSNIKLNVHYFEDGNVQLNNGIEKLHHIKVSDVDATAKAVAELVRKLETDFHTKLDELIMDMHAKTFKAMRRFLPITRMPMNWNVNAHQVASEMHK